MIDINWNLFKEKFNGKEQKSFEDLCYLLFCKEFGKPYGINRLKNHPGIETHPIEVNGKWIGFQSKFASNTTKIKPKLIEAIDKAKLKNPEISTVRFYLSEDFSSNPKPDQTDPQYKTDVENHAQTKGIEIDWKTASHFDSEFVRIQNKEIARHFFTHDKNIINAIEELHHRTQSVFDAIKSEINFNGTNIKIDKSQNAEDLKSSLNSSSVVIVCGEGGVGKTAIVKDFYQSVVATASIFLFKATQFIGIRDVNELFSDTTLLSFLKEYANVEQKYIVIDSAEKLSDLENQEIFKEFFLSLLKDGWKVIFTTRYSYLDDLRFLLGDCGVISQNIDIKTLTEDELMVLSKEYGFEVPSGQNITKLLCNPFYLNEYLNNNPQTLDISEFKKSLWKRRILKSGKNNIHQRIEECFLKIAQKRANDGKFYVDETNGDNEALQSLQDDEIIKYESGSGYFIVHDIYEEWALDKIIEGQFVNFTNHQNFFQNIGSSLPIRRAFRSWLSEKLLTNKEGIKSFIEETVSSAQLDSYWRDEVLVSVLLSDYSSKFFELFDGELKGEDQTLLFRIIFLLQTACKEVDDSLLKSLLIQQFEEGALELLLTKPKGLGWNCLIDFLHENQSVFGLKNIKQIIPILKEWNEKNIVGNTTKKVSQIALNYYNELTKNRQTSWRNSSETKELAKIILNGALEIKEELQVIFDAVVRDKATDRSDRYYDLVKLILANNAPNAVKALPNQVIELMNLFWSQNENLSTQPHYRSHLDIENYFGISDSYELKYYPSSALQTPISQLLILAPIEAVNFILSFVNKAAETYASSSLNEAEEIKIIIDNHPIVSQIVSRRLWNAFRGNQVSTYLLESLHMALERWLLLLVAKNVSKEIFESWCIYLIKNSKSASITAVVSSVVLAHPFKLFNVAKILFRTKELFYYDRERATFDMMGDSLLMLGFFPNPRDEIYTNERTKACADKHRKSSLEDLLFRYQFECDESENEEIFTKRNKSLHTILDEHWKALPPKDLETDKDKNWRLALEARMDRRRMNPELGEHEGQQVIKFNPQIDPELEKYRKDAIQPILDQEKYSALQLWARQRFARKAGYEKYEYENDIKLAIKRTKEIIEKLPTENDFFVRFSTTTAYVCSVLIRDFFENLTDEEKLFCKDQILLEAILPLQVENYHQISREAKPSILVLSHLIKHFPEDRKSIITLLLLLLISPWKEVSSLAIVCVFSDLWKDDHKCAHEIFLGYILLNPKYEALEDKIRSNPKNSLSLVKILEKFTKENNDDLEKIISGRIDYKNLTNIDQISIETMIKAFELLPLNVVQKDQKEFINIVFSSIAKTLFSSDRDDEIEYDLKMRFLRKAAAFILSAEQSEVLSYLKPFIDNFKSSENATNFFHTFVLAQDRMNRYENFWIVWNAFRSKIIEVCNSGSSYHFEGNIKSYLLAQYPWNRGIKEWHSLKDREKAFYKEIAEKIGYNSSVLYSMAKVLNDIGSSFAEDGITWISDILQKNNHNLLEKVEPDTVYYLEIFMKKFQSKNRQTIKKSPQLKKRIIVILDFLIEHGSAKGYLLREDIL